MRDPHVESLRYLLRPSEDVTFDQPPPIEWDTDDFHMRLENGVAIFEMRRHYPSKEAAQQAVEAYLRTWEIDAALGSNRAEIHFDFDSAEIIDRDPPPPGTTQVICAGSIVATGKLSMVVTRARYPDIPSNFVLSPDVESIWNRYQGYLDGRELLTTMGYFCLTVVEASTGKKSGRRSAASKDYSIEDGVLNKLGYLSSEVGNVGTARKMPRVPRDHTPQETAWIEAAVKKLIRRMGEYAYDQNFDWPQITMKNLPELP